jgi:hypothetical protein
MWDYAASDHMRLALVLLIALCQGALYMALLPPWQHYDEPTHFEYAWLSANRALLPQATDIDRAMRRELAASMLEQHFYWNLAQPTLFDNQKPIDVGVSELGHPPGYYLLVSLPLRLVRHLDMVSQLYVARSVSVLLLLVSIAAAAGLMREITPPRHDLRWAVPLALALLPTFIDLMTAVNNDVGAVAVFSVFVWGAARTIRRGLSWRRVLWLFASAVLAALVKNTAAVALALAPLAVLVAFWLRRGWRWRWLFAAVAGCLLLAVPLLFSWGDAAFWYRGNVQTAQVPANRAATPLAPLGDHALMLETPATGAQLLISPLANVPLQDLAGQTLTAGAWVWADRPGVLAEIGVAYKTPTQPAAIVMSQPITVTTTPTFIAQPFVLPGQVSYIHYQIVARLPQATTPAAHLYVDGALLAPGQFPRGAAPAFASADAASGEWGGQPFTNLLRNPSGERTWPRLRPALDSLLLRYIHRSPAQVVAAFMDVQRIVPEFWPLLVQPAVESMVMSFAWSHVRLSNVAWLYLAQGLAILALLGSLRWLLKHRPTREQQAAMLFLLFVDLLIWVNMLLRPLPLLGEVFVVPAARYTFPALGITMLILLGGWRALWPPRWQARVTFALLAGLFIMNLVAIQTITAFYQAVRL